MSTEGIQGTGKSCGQETMLRVVEDNEGYTSGSPMSGNDTLDSILRECQMCGINTVEGLIPGYKKVVRVGNIALSAGPHDTGCDVSGWIIDGDQAYRFISTTYWYSSHYTFNRSKWVRGAWDNAVTAAINELRQKVWTVRAKSEEAKAKKEQAAQQQHADNRARFGAQFTKAAS